MINELQYKPETTDALIDAIPDNVYHPCPCGCNMKWRFVIKQMAEDEHVKRFCDKYEREHKSD